MLQYFYSDIIEKEKIEEIDRRIKLEEFYLTKDKSESVRYIEFYTQNYRVSIRLEERIGMKEYKESPIFRPVGESSYRVEKNSWKSPIDPTPIKCTKEFDNIAQVKKFIFGA
jgi:hypothetical protein